MKRVHFYDGKEGCSRTSGLYNAECPAWGFIRTNIFNPCHTSEESRT